MLPQTSQLPEPELTPRQQEILRTVVQEYVSSASPVGSSTVRLVGALEVSTATIRNELAALEELGYVAQPHTSAGRCPTVRGYRYFVERLMDDAELPLPDQRLIRHQFHQIRLNLDQWMRLTAAVLARIGRSASLVTPPHAAQARFRRIELISINETMCLMVLVLQDSSIHQEIIPMEPPMDQSALTRLSNLFNAVLANRSVEDVHDNVSPELADLDAWGSRVLNRLIQIMEGRDAQSIREVYRDGLVNVLRQPEFEDAEKSRQVIEVMEHPSVLESILAKILHANGVQIIIGGEGEYQQIDDVSLILSPYGVRGRATGVLGIMGPTRMSYAHGISTVRYVAHVMDDLIADVYGAGQTDPL